jgi:hypothetical protein
MKVVPKKCSFAAELEGANSAVERFNRMLWAKLSRIERRSCFLGQIFSPLSHLPRRIHDLRMQATPHVINLGLELLKKQEIGTNNRVNTFYQCYIHKINTKKSR